MPTARSPRSSSRRSVPSTACCRRVSSESARRRLSQSRMARKPKPHRRSGGTVRPDVALEAVRARIDAVDEQIQTLINERARLAQQVGISKAKEGHTVDFYRPERE